MKNNTIVLKTFMILSIIIMCITFSSNIYAAVSDNVEDWELSMNATGADMQNYITKIAGFLFALIRTATIVISIPIIIIIGIKYINGTVDEKAKNKQMLINIVIGAVLLATVSGIVSAVFNSLYIE